MGTELGGTCFKKDNMEISSIPPGFETPIRITLKRTEVNQVINRSSPANASKAQNVELEMQFDNSETSRSLSHRSWTKYNELDNSSSDQIEFEQDISRNRLPKGVIRGCEACNNCQKVTAKWHPEESRRPDLEEAPVFYPTEEEFEDTLKYISSIRSKAEMYGICRIVPPPSWKPPCPLKEKNIWERSKFTTRTQRIDKLQNRYSKRKRSQVNDDKRRKKKICRRSEVDHGNGTQEIKILGEDGLSNAERFGFEPGLDFTLDAFQKYDEDFKAQYFRKLNNSSTSGGNKIIAEEQWQPTVEDIEGEYWRIVEKPTEEIEVLYGADLDTGAFGSGFPKKSQQVASASASDIDYINSGWNLNNFPRLPGSVLSFESSDISGVVVPWLYIGMCFSSFCWHVEDHHMYSLNYMHWGAPKMWYGVPGSDAIKLETAMRKHLPDLFEEQPDLLHQLVTQLSPSRLRSEGVPVYRCLQNSGEFVLTFPRAYHAGFNCGFNCAEAVNIAPVDWLPHGQDAVELYREQGRRTSVSHDKLLLSAAREAVKADWEYNFQKKHTSKKLRWREVCGKDGILSKTLKTRVEAEQAWRESFKKLPVLKMESSFDANTERECCVCLFDLHLSAVGCHHCSPNKYACLKHAKQLCSCSWGSKFFLFRYDIGELNLLVEALEGKLSAVYQWARFDMGLALSSSAPRDNMQICTSQGSASKEISPITEEQKEQVHDACLDLTKYIDNVNSSRIVRAPVVVLALECVKTSECNSRKVKSAKLSRKKENSEQLPPQHKIQSGQASQCDSLKGTLEALYKAEVNESEHKDVIIILSDDEEDEPSKELCVVKGTTQNSTIAIENSVSPDNMTNLGGCTNRSASTTTVTAPVHVSISCIEVQDHAEAESYIGANPPYSSCIKFSLTDLDSNKDVPTNKETREHDKANAECPRQQQTDDGISKGDDGCKELRLDVELSSKDSILTVSSPSGHQNNLDGCYRQKGPRIAKVVRKINCNVEALEFGSVRAEKLWCDSRAIYPMGFRSRVRYIDVVDPTKMCHYVSEILEAGLDGPLFMVSVEHSPSEVFIHISASRCWELVRERVNQEIIKQRKLGRQKLPPVQPPGSVDGIEMFGFSSPAIMQVIQSMDQNHICKEYWQSRAVVLQTCEQSQPVDSSTNFTAEPLARKKVERILSGLFEKANTEELHTLYSLMNNENLVDEQSLLRRLLMGEKNMRSRQIYGLRDVGSVEQVILDL